MSYYLDETVQSAIASWNARQRPADFPAERNGERVSVYTNEHPSFAANH